MLRRGKETQYENTLLRIPPTLNWTGRAEHPKEDEIELADEAERDDEETGEGEEGEASGGSSGGGPEFDQTEHDFDPTELQGLSLPIFRRALKKGLKLVRRMTKESERYVRGFLPQVELHSRVLEVALSEKGHPTLLLDKGQIVQYQLSHGKLERVLTSPDLEAEQAVKYAMAGFLAAGESIDPAHVKFGRTPEFQARMKPIWVREWKRIQQEQDADLEMTAPAPKQDAKFVAEAPREKPAATRKAPQQAQDNKLRADMPRVGTTRRTPSPSPD